MPTATHTPRLGRRALLADCMAHVLAATDPVEVEVAFQSGLKRLLAEYGSYFDRSYGRACDKLRWDAANVRGLQLADTMAEGRLLPRIGARRRLTVNGESYSIGYGGNGAGERYVWAAAREWTAARLTGAGLPADKIKGVLDWWGWPHRALCELAGIDLRAAIAKAEAS